MANIIHPQTLVPEIKLRINKISEILRSQNTDAILIFDNANLYYTSGRVFNGYTYINAVGDFLFFVKRPVGLTGDNVVYIRKPEQITEELLKHNHRMPKSIALEFDTASYSEIERIKHIFSGSDFVNGSSVMRNARSVKTKYEIRQLKESGIRHCAAYKHIGSIYRDGMTDIELQIEIERLLRREGSLGLFRVSGQSMEIFMGSLICGDNADNPTPYDFAMGGAGLDPSLPVGSNGTTIKRGMTVMIDMCGNFNGYMTDMTRVFYHGHLDEMALKAHNLSIDIHHELMDMAKPGTPAAQLYDKAVEIVKSAGMERYFMGHHQQAGFIGHGVGIEINELPVLSPRSKDILKENNIIAIEPKFVIPHVGAVGIENTYAVTEQGLELITPYPEDITEI